MAALPVGATDGKWASYNAADLLEVVDEVADAYGEGDFTDNATAAITSILTIAERVGVDLFVEDGSKAPGAVAVLIENGAPKNAAMPRIARDGDGGAVLVIGDTKTPVELSGKTFQVGELKGDLEREPIKTSDGREISLWKASLKDAETGDRFKVAVRMLRDANLEQIEDARDEDRLIDVIEPSGTGGGGGKAISMGDLEVGEYLVTEVKQIKLENGNSFFVLLVDVNGVPTEVKSRRDIDALLKMGLDVPALQAKGRQVFLVLFDKEEIKGKPGTYYVSCTLRSKKVEVLKPAAKARAGAARVQALVAEEQPVPVTAEF
ncbi:hypothetical protein KBY83_12100 [Cyanobium sp. WKJ7-Wakatipu]|uniref:hypothetical protein n=1 Tax=Cyanobium sp. WKJ7-Wakatipu TaxID=2823726 RepID=UPI0020CC1413|nr:hypothetical protein [Cyanobium sp. WKJ7-Wakatipu]MCP9784046.1 hypothetical protein [Cyanobium sp. WKJ7-Wakatipu]